MTAKEIVVPYARLKEGLERIRGYSLQEREGRVDPAFEPRIVEAPGQPVPCLRIVFRKKGTCVALEKFSVCNGDEETPVDLEAAHDALQAWVDWMSS